MMKDIVIGRRNKLKLELIAYKGGKCKKCGYCKNIPSVYVFHHRNPKEKSFGISGKSLSIDLMKAEVDKCDLLCCNCHNEVHHELTQKRREEHGIPHLQIVSVCVNCNKKFVSRANRKNCYSCKRKIKRNLNIDKYELELMMCSMSWKDICKKYSVVESCIRKWAKKYNLDRNKITSIYFTFSSNGRDMKIYKRELELMMCTMTWVDIGKKYSVNESCVRKWAKKYNLDRNKIRSRFLVSGSA